MLGTVLAFIPHIKMNDAWSSFPRVSLVLGNFNTLEALGISEFPLCFPSGEVISSVSELQSLKVEPSAEKEKQRSEAKHIGCLLWYLCQVCCSESCNFNCDQCFILPKTVFPYNKNK